MSNFFPPIHWTNLLIIPGLLVGYTVHELAHAFMAYYLGDYSQIERGKITLNPFRHISWFGSFSFLLFGVGWSNPIELDRHNFKSRPLAVCAIAAAGPIASFTFSLAGLLFTLFLAAMLVYNSNASTDEILLLLFPATVDTMPQMLDLQALTIAFTSKIAVASFWLAFISLLPLPGLDGFAIINGLVLYFKGKNSERRPQAKRITPSEPINQVERRNNVSDIHFKLGAEYHRDKKYDDAIMRYRQAVANDENFGPAYVNLGLAYLGKGKRKEAIHAFRGAVQYADDQKSQQEAWYQLHLLSEVSPVGEDAENTLNQLGASPWTDTKPKPNWAGLIVGASLLLMGGVFLYSYLFTNLVNMFNA